MSGNGKTIGGDERNWRISCVRSIPDWYGATLVVLNRISPIFCFFCFLLFCFFLFPVLAQIRLSSTIVVYRFSRAHHYIINFIGLFHSISSAQHVSIPQHKCLITFVSFCQPNLAPIGKFG
jgi:hypothetical protein